MNNNKENITTEEFDLIFDEGKEDITKYLDLSSARRINQETKRVNVDFPPWIVAALDKEASRIGITRQAFIKVIVAERLDALDVLSALPK